MRKENFITIGVVSAALVYGASAMYSNGIDNKIKEEFNPIKITNQITNVDTKLETIKSKISTGIEDAEYLKVVKGSDLTKDIKEIKLVKNDLESVSNRYSNWKVNNKELLDASKNYENWDFWKKVSWIRKTDNLKETIKSFDIVERNFAQVEGKIDGIAKESLQATKDFIANNEDTGKLLDKLSSSHKTLNIINDKSLATEKVVNYLHSNSNIINTFKIKDSKEKLFDTNVYVGKISVISNKISYGLKEQDQSYKSLFAIKDKPLNTAKEQREWVLAVKNVNAVLNNQSKEKIEKLKTDLDEVENEVNPAFEQIKELEAELKEVVIGKIKDGKFDLNAVANKYKENINQEVKSDLDEAKANEDSAVIHDLNEIETIAITKIEEDKNLVNELVQKVGQENKATETATATNSGGGMNLFHYYLMYSWLNNSSSNNLAATTTPTSGVTSGVASNFGNTSKFLNNASPVNNLSNMYTVKTADGGYSTDGIIGSKLNNNLKTKSTNSYRSISVRKISVGRTSSMSMGG